MKTRSLALGSVGLAAALSLAVPAMAQGYSANSQDSTPAERAQTQQLNQQSTSGTTQSPSQLNGEAAPEQTLAQSDSGEYQDRQQNYEDQQQEYQDRQQRYDDQREQYREQRHQYVRDLRRYDLARYEWTDYPRVYVYRYEGPQLRRLYLIADPTHQLAQVPVEGPSGRFIGKVRDVQTGVDGRPVRVEVALNRVVSVLVPPGHFRFDADSRVLFTDLTRDELWSMPGATVESGTYRP
jgi:hypothetical protein